MRNFVLGVATVAIAALAIAVYYLGQSSGLEVGWAALAIALAGAAITEWLTFGLTGRHLTPGEVFQDMAATGLLAAAASPLLVLQAPGAWSDVLLLSRSVAAIALVLYHAANAYRLATSGRHLGATAGALIVGTPYVAGALLLLERGNLMQLLGQWLTAGEIVSPAVLQTLGRGLVVFLFNEAVANGLALATKRRPLASFPAHLALLAAAAGVVLAPWAAGSASSEMVAAWPAALRALAVVAATVVSQAGLWAEVYLITGMVLDAVHGKAPSRNSALGHPAIGMKKGMIFSGLFMAVVYGLALLWNTPAVMELAIRHPLLAGVIFGAAVFPLGKTIIESFDGSGGFFRRLRKSYRDPVLYARGCVIGCGLAYAATLAMSERAMQARVEFGFAVGLAAFAGVSLLRDCIYAAQRRGRPVSWRPYFVEAVFGGLIGAAIGFYLDTAQIAEVSVNFQAYLSGMSGTGWQPVLQETGWKPVLQGVQADKVRDLLSRWGEIRVFLEKWGTVQLGTPTDGASLLFNQALAGVIKWSIPAWLFAVNRTFMTAWFRRETAPIRGMLTKDGFTALSQNMIEVLRWGLWMSPIICSFLRPMGDPTWYNQDGAIHTAVAVVRDATMTPDAFRAWSLQVFIYLLAFDAVRVLIWLDHMGLRVATLVNLSFLGMDRLDERLARWFGPAATAQCIPESVKRFATWAPLLIPYYIPMGADWDTAWSSAEALSAAQGAGPVAAIVALSLASKLLLAAGCAIGCTAVFAAARALKERFGRRRQPVWTLSNTQYEVVLRGNGEALSRTLEKGYDLTRRSYDLLDPAGRALFLVDVGQASQPDVHVGQASQPDNTVAPGGSRPAGGTYWPVLGNFPREHGELPHIERRGESLLVTHANHGIRATIEVCLPSPNDAAELWTITLENQTDVAREMKVVPYLEWVLNRPDADRGHTQYNRLFAELEYVAGLNALLAWDKHSKAMGVLAADVVSEGFLTSRVDFLGRARSIWSPRALETLAFSQPCDTAGHPTFDPIGSLLLTARLAPKGSAQVRLLIGQAKDKKQAIELVSRHLDLVGRVFQPVQNVAGTLRVPDVDGLESPSYADKARRAGSPSYTHSIGHGEIPPGTPQPYWEFKDCGRRLLVHTPFTPRPYDHTMSNAPGHVTVVTNRGLHTTSSGNSQQNRLTPDWPDTVTREVPGEAFYLHDPASGEWFSPTYHPMNDADAEHEVEFRVDGSAVFHMRRGTLSTELAVFVPPEDPTGVYLLTVRNHGDAARQLRLAPYFQIVLANQPEAAGPLAVRHDRQLNAVFFENPRNGFRTGPAFVAMSQAAECVETKRGRFFGAGRGVARPFMLEHGEADATGAEDDRPVAALLATLDIPAHGERTIAVVLGQADTRRQAEAVIRKYQNTAAARASLEHTRQWWLGMMDTLQVETGDAAMSQYLNWLKYQALAERIWARRGFYQASGAYGFRDQLQDSVNLIWMEPALARWQILLHASQQFLEGDTVHWFHLLQDGRTGFAARTHASDNLLWLAWAVGEYVQQTGDETLLDERAPYLTAEQPFEPLPGGKHGMGFVPRRSSRTDTIYRHAMKAIDLVLDSRMGRNGLPLIGTGDWNDGLDEIGSQGRGESVWLGFFLYYILDHLVGVVGRRDGQASKEHYVRRAHELKDALERTWRGDRYLRAIHDDGTEIGVAGSGVWEIDALTAAWAVMSGVNPQRGRTVFDTALGVLEKEKVVLLGWPALREDTKPYLGRSSWYPEGVRENGMYCHGVQWLVGAARILADQCERQGDLDSARRYCETAWRLWRKISPLAHVTPEEIETYGGQPNQQAADMLTAFDPGRMIWNGYTGAAGWMFRQALEGVLGARLVRGELVPPADLEGAEGPWNGARVFRRLERSPLARHAAPARSEHDGPKPQCRSRLPGGTSEVGLRS